MGKVGKGIFNFLVVIQFLVIGVAVGLSAYILSLAPTADNVLSIVFVAFSGFAMFSTLMGIFGCCTQSSCLYKCHGLTGIVCVLIFAITAILSGLWYGGVDVLPQFEFSGQNITELCLDFNQTDFVNEQNLLLDEITNAENAEVTDSPVAPLQNNVTNAVEATSVAPITTVTSLNATDDKDTQTWTFHEGRILFSYCRVEGYIRDIIFGRRADGSIENETKSSKIMLGILIVACILFLFYFITTCLAFHTAKRVREYSY